jgi:hypothetical protein
MMLAIKMGFCQSSIANECMTSPHDEAHIHIGILKEGKQYTPLHLYFQFPCLFQFTASL